MGRSQTTHASSAAPRLGGRGPRPSALGVLLAALALTASLAAASIAAEAPTRPEYVARLERICKPGSEATQRAVRGVRADVRAERLRLAATKFSRAKRIFAHTVRAISTVPRPPADRATLARWFAALGRENALPGSHRRRPSRLGRRPLPARLGRLHPRGQQANNVVVSFGFNYCSFKPSRFQ